MQIPIPLADHVSQESLIAVILVAAILTLLVLVLVCLYCCKSERGGGGGGGCCGRSGGSVGKPGAKDFKPADLERQASLVRYRTRLEFPKQDQKSFVKFSPSIIIEQINFTLHTDELIVFGSSGRYEKRVTRAHSFQRYQ